MVHKFITRNLIAASVTCIAVFSAPAFANQAFAPQQGYQYVQQPTAQHLQQPTSQFVQQPTGQYQQQQSTYSNAETYLPGIWIDPDGCQHWAMDDGTEGFMTPNLTPDGRPVCTRKNLCAVLGSDQFFRTNSATLSPSQTQQLRNFFASAGAGSYGIYGHTDSRASDAYNMRLSQRRANAVARVAQSVGASVGIVQGQGESQPVASNKTTAGRAKNRRVEITCLR